MPEAEEEEAQVALDEHGTPSDGMCCLCTMEDITDEDKNYGECQWLDPPWEGLF